MNKTTTRAESSDSAQISLFDDLIARLSNAGGVSSGQLSSLIDKLSAARKQTQKREKLEQKRKERTAAAKKAEEERLQKEAHIREVTSMDLPLDWENLFAGYLKTISARAENVRNGRVPRSQDNMLKIATDGRQAALDQGIAKTQERKFFPALMLYHFWYITFRINSM